MPPLKYIVKRIIGQMTPLPTRPGCESGYAHSTVIASVSTT